MGAGKSPRALFEDIVCDQTERKQYPPSKIVQTWLPDKLSLQASMDMSDGKLKLNLCDFQNQHCPVIVGLRPIAEFHNEVFQFCRWQVLNCF